VPRRSLIVIYNVCAVCGKKIPPNREELSCPICGSSVFKLVRVESKGNDVTLASKRGKAREKVETVKILRRGVFEIDLEALLQGKPLIVSDREGAYRISLQNLAKNKFSDSL